MKEELPFKNERERDAYFDNIRAQLHRHDFRLIVNDPDAEKNGILCRTCGFKAGTLSEINNARITFHGDGYIMCTLTRLDMNKIREAEKLPQL